ncbi:hypothetical protein AV530_006003 [Patagioenas fasciata monilis]|uniref:Uncharacterized protein n=1 Tax=Patagioenas fasciata monilis TaxID=372326 RepID=A0A1V4JNG4_PATFA|nr:hypothetical protein AV530_006003 [Patagioenas fasciata monilis]
MNEIKSHPEDVTTEKDLIFQSHRSCGASSMCRQEDQSCRRQIPCKVLVSPHPFALCIPRLQHLPWAGAK